LVRQTSRVRGVGWFQEKLVPHAACPVCGARQEAAKRELEHLSEAAETLSIQSRSMESATTGLERERIKTLASIRNIEADLREARRQREELEVRDEEGRASGQSLEEVYRFVGRLEQALLSMREIDDDSFLVRRLQEIDARLRVLEVELNEVAKISREQFALEKISRVMGHYAEFMGLERSGDLIRLDLRDLTLTFEGQASNRVDYLWEIGSGANWMGYHIAAFLAIHEYVGDNNPLGPVPSFVVIDQPSQVYFPSDYFARQEAGAEGSFSGGDLAATRRIFEAISEGLRRMKFNIQFIVTEHADAAAWGGIEGVVEIANWHNHADFLVPKSWLTEEESNPLPEEHI
jgi:hypothetical protein